MVCSYAVQGFDLIQVRLALSEGSLFQEMLFYKDAILVGYTLAHPCSSGPPPRTRLPYSKNKQAYTSGVTRSSSSQHRHPVHYPLTHGSFWGFRTSAILIHRTSTILIHRTSTYSIQRLQNSHNFMSWASQEARGSPSSSHHHKPCGGRCNVCFKALSA